MFRIDTEANALVELEQKKFSELNFREREHLQVWIEKYPEILGEELLIIQKEFDGWSETKERLDLLALDKNAQLVIIENKLDDSGKDVVWQSLKYAAYCSTLDTEAIVEMYAKYLGVQADLTVAQSNLLDFFEVGSVEELNLNDGASQRIMLTAANFRPEVTATCLWLISRGIQIECIQVRPFQDGEKLYLSADQIIPTPSSEDFMVRVGAKEKSGTRKTAVVGEWKKTRRDFFEGLTEKLTGRAAKIFANRTPGTDHWLTGATGTSGLHYDFIFLKNMVRVNVTMDRGSKLENKFVYDYIENHSQQINADFPEPLNWMRLDNRKSSRITVEHELDMTDRANWEEAQSWLDKTMNIVVRIFQKHLENASTALSQQDLENNDEL